MFSKEKSGTGKCSRHKVQCTICNEIFDNDYVKKHTDKKHHDLHKQNRLAPVFKPGEHKRKDPWSAAIAAKKKIVTGTDNNPRECNDTPKEGKTQFSFLNSCFKMSYLLFIKIIRLRCGLICNMVRISVVVVENTRVHAIASPENQRI